MNKKPLTPQIERRIERAKKLRAALSKEIEILLSLPALEKYAYDWQISLLLERGELGRFT